MKRGFYKRKGANVGKHSQRKVNEVKVKAGDVEAMVASLQALGTTVWVGWTGDDFDTNHMTLRQYVRLPRILKNN